MEISVKTFENIFKRKIKIKYASRRRGDVLASFANSDKAKKLLNWKYKIELNDWLEDTVSRLLKNKKDMKEKNKISNQ